MKLKNLMVKILVAAAVIFGAAERVMAQGDFDWYALDKDVQLIALCSNGVAGATGTNTSQPIDIGHGKFIGSAFVDVFFMTNWGTNTGAITIQSSPDTTNWTTLTNVAVSTNLSFIYTNMDYAGTNGIGSALLATNYELNPFANVTPNSSAAGWATSYPVPQPFTTTALALVPNYTGPTNSTVGFGSRYGIQNVNDLPEYLRVSIQYSGTNYFSSTFHGRRSK